MKIFLDTANLDDISELESMIDDILVYTKHDELTKELINKIDLYSFNQFGNLIASHSYSAKNDLGILYDDEPIALPGKYLFKDDGPYEITIEDFDCKLALNAFNTSKRNLRDNLFDLIVALKVKSKADSDYEKLFPFEQQIFSLSQFSITKVEDEDEGEEI